MTIYQQLFLTFAKIGAVTFGGGYAMLPILERELSQKHGWVTSDDLVDYFAIGQCTPGIIAVNIATFVGHKKGGVVGAICATLGIVFPSLLIIMTIAMFISNFASLPLVINAFAGIRVGTTVLILFAIIKLWQKTIKDKISLLVFVTVLLLSLFTSISSATIVIVTGVAFWLVHYIREVRQ